MPKYSYPGVYVKEAPSGPGPVTGASTSNLALVGSALEGPLNDPTLVTSMTEFKQAFGGFTSTSLLPTAANLFFANGGTNLYVCRVAGASSQAASNAISKSATAEALTPDSAPNGVLTTLTFSASNALDNSPLTVVDSSGSLTNLAGQITMTIGSAVTTITIGEGGAITSSPAGVTGTADLATGELVLNFSSAPAAGAAFVATIYFYEAFGIEMKWPGTAGNDFRVSVSGDPLFDVPATASFTRFSLSVERLVRNDDGSATTDYETLETFSGLVLDDATSENYIKTVINDTQGGSAYVKVTAATAGIPGSLQGTQKASQALTPDVSFNGSTRAFQASFNSTDAVSQTSFVGSLDMELGGIVIGTADGTDTPSVTMPYGTLSSINGGGIASMTITGTVSGSPLVATLNGTNLESSGNVYGTVVLSTGAVTIDTTAAGATAFDNNTLLTLTAAKFTNPTKFVDDGEGALSISTTDTGLDIVTLDPNGNNSITYEGLTSSTNPFINVTFKVVGFPTVGPGSNSSITGDYYTVASSGAATNKFRYGADGAALRSSDVSSPSLAPDEKGVYALNKTDELLQVIIPDFESDSTVSGQLIDYCLTRNDRFAILSVPEGKTPNQAVAYAKRSLNKNTSYAAIYYPHVRVVNPVTNKAMLMGPASVVAGIYARVDSNRNVSKAPAGVGDAALQQVLGLERSSSPSEVGTLNDSHVNSLVDWPYTGTVVWGARTMERGGSFPYIQMRRLFMFLEKSVFNSTQRHVFESNTAALRLQIKLQVESFLLNLYNSGHFSGTSPSEAFFVVCDNTNNTAKTIAQGLLFCDIGVAPTRPAEFIVFRFQQKALTN